MSHTVQLAVIPEEAYVAPGGQRDVALTVTSAGDSAAHYRLDVSGIPAAWYHLSQPRLALLPAAAARVYLALHLPADATSAAGRYPITVQVTSEDDPADCAAARLLLTVAGGGGLDMEVRPAEAAGQEATFHVAFFNQLSAPVAVVLSARDGADGLRVHVEPQDPVLVPGGATEVLATVHVSPKEPHALGAPQSYEIKLRGRDVGGEPGAGHDLAAQARFTYVPPAPPGRPAWLRRLPVSTLALMLALLFVLLLQAYLAMQPAATPSVVPTPVLPGAGPQQPAATVLGVAVRVPTIQRFSLLQPHPSLPYMLVWQTSNATAVTLDGRPVAAQGHLTLSPPLHSTTFQLTARTGRRLATARVQIVVRATTSGAGVGTPPAAPGTQSFVLALPHIVTFTLQRRGSSLFVVWQVYDASQVWLQRQAVPRGGERRVPAGVSALELTARNSVGEQRRSLPLPRPAAATAPPAALLIPDVLSFGTQGVGTPSAAEAMHIVNLGPATLTIASVAISGADAHDFKASDTCAGATVPAYHGCTMRISFTPLLSGPRRASVVIADNAVDSPQIVPLSGTGQRPLS